MLFRRLRSMGPSRATPDSVFFALRVFLGLPRAVIMWAGVVAVAAIGVFDWATGPFLDPAILYVLAVTAVAFHNETRDGLLLALMATIEGAMTPLWGSEDVGLSGWTLAWNLTMRFAVLVFLVMVMSALRRTIDRLRRQAATDALTGALNRATLTAAIDRERARALRDGAPMTVAFFDLDGLRDANNRYGHEEGDRLLARFSAIVSAAIRPYDLFGRVGGDEFVLVLHDTDEIEATGVIRRLYESLRRSGLEGERPIRASAGVVTFVRPLDSVKAMVAEADALMYRAKHAGGRRAYGAVHTGGEGDALGVAVVIDLHEAATRHPVSGVTAA